MNSFLKMLIALAIATLFFSVPVNAQLEDYDCAVVNCDSIIYSIVSDALLWNYHLNYTDYFYPNDGIDIYGNRVYNSPYSYGRNYAFNQYRNYPYIGFGSQHIFPSTDTRNEQARADYAQIESRAINNSNKYISSGSTLRTVTINNNSNNTTSQNNAIPPNQGWIETTPKESFLEDEGADPNKLFFEAPENEISCKNLGFEYEVLDVDSMQSTLKELRIKNTAGENFFIDSIFVQETSSKLNAFGSILDPVILENFSGRVKVKIDALDVEKDIVETISVNVTGHFENGKNCGVERDFLVGINGHSNTIVNSDSYDFDVPSKIELVGSGFGELSLDNPTDTELKIIISTGDNAVVNPRIIVVSKNSFVQRVFSINQATKNEFIYYTVSADGRVLEQKYSKIVSPTVTEPQTPVLTEEQNVIINGFSSKIMFVNGNADISVALQNNSNNPKEVLVTLSNPPKGVSFNPVTLTVGALETRNFKLQLQDIGIEEFPFNAILSVKFDGKTINRQIMVERIEGAVNSTVMPPENQNPLNEVQVSGFISTGFAVIQENTASFSLVLLFLLIATFLIGKIIFPGNNYARETWAARK